MSKTIWLKGETYNRLSGLRIGRETFDDIVNRLMRVFRAIQRIPSAQTGEDFFGEEPDTNARAKKAAVARRDSPEVPNVPTG